MSQYSFTFPAGLMGGFQPAGAFLRRVHAERALSMDQGKVLAIAGEYAARLVLCIVCLSGCLRMGLYRNYLVAFVRSSQKKEIV